MNISRSGLTLVTRPGFLMERYHVPLGVAALSAS